MASLDDVYEEIREDNAWDYLREPGIVLVKGKGQTDNPLAMVVGGTPGATENTHRRPFMGHIGRLLGALMGLAGLSAEWRGKQTGFVVPPGCDEGVPPNAFVTHLTKYRLPGNRVPNTREIILGTEQIRAEWMAIGRPRLLVAVGSPARAALAPVERRIAPGDWTMLGDGQTYVWVHYHPNYGIQHPEARPEMEMHWAVMGAWIRDNL